MRMSKVQKAAEQAFLNAFKVQGNCVEFSVLDLGKMKADTFAGVAAGKTMEQSLAEAVAKYRKN
jgi:hypothetical protein